MLARLDADRNPAGYPQAEHVLGVVRDARRITVAPYRIDFEHVLQVPVGEVETRGLDASLLADLADRGVAQPLALVLAAGHRLPEAGMVGALEQQDLERGRVDHDERRDRDLYRAPVPHVRFCRLVPRPRRA